MATKAYNQADLDEALAYLNEKKLRNKPVPVSRPIPSAPDDPEKAAHVHQEYPKIKYAKATKERPAAIEINPLYQINQPQSEQNSRFLKPLPYVMLEVADKATEDALEKGVWFDTPDLGKK